MNTPSPYFFVYGIRTLCVISIVGSVFSSSFLCYASTRSIHPKENITRVRLGAITAIDDKGHFITISLGTTTIRGEYCSTTEIYTGDGEKVSIDALKDTMPIYLFGNLAPSNQTMTVEKVVIKNTSKLTRKYPNDTVTKDVTSQTKDEAMLWLQLFMRSTTTSKKIAYSP